MSANSPSHRAAGNRLGPVRGPQTAARPRSWVCGLTAGCCFGLLTLCAPPAAGQTAASLLPGVTELAPLTRQGEVETYRYDTLWERIDGQAEIYRRFGIREAAFALYALDDLPDRRVEVSVFELGGPLHAFGVFAYFRPAGTAERPMGASTTFATDYQAFLWQGRHFVIADAAGSTRDKDSDLLRALEAVAGRLGSKEASPPILSAFSRLVRSGTAAYVPDHLLGLTCLPPGLEGKTPDGLSVFVATGKTAGRQALDACAPELKGPRFLRLSELEALAADDPGAGPLLLAWRGDRLAGVRASAEHVGVADLFRRLLEIPPADE